MTGEYTSIINERIAIARKCFLDFSIMRGVLHRSKSSLSMKKSAGPFHGFT